MNTALIAVDLQNDFITGPLGSSDAVAVVPKIIEFSQAHPEYERFASMDWHPRAVDLPKVIGHHVLEYGEHCVRNTQGAELDPRFATQRGSWEIVRKGQQGADPSAFDGVDVEGFKLDTLLRLRKVSHVIVVGLVLNVCVLATALDALKLGYNVTVIRDLTASLTPAGRAWATNTLRRAGAIVVDTPQPIQVG